MNSTASKIQFHKVRDFGETFNTAIAFMRENFKPLTKCILYTAGPFLLISMIFSLIINYQFSYLTEQVLSMDWEAMNNTTSYGIGTQLFLLASYIISILGTLLVCAVIYEYIILYIKKEASQTISLEEVQKAVFKNLGMYIGTTILLGFLYFFSLIIIALLGGFVTAIIGSISIALVILIMFVGIVAGILIAIIPLSTIYILRAWENIGFVPSVSRCFKLMKNFWGSTFALLLAYIMILFILSLALTLPALILGSFTSMLFEGDNKILVWLINGLSAITSLANVITVGTMSVVLSLRYFTLLEYHEGHYVKQKIEQIGQPSESENDPLNYS